jgi:hypothetical protein
MTTISLHSSAFAVRFGHRFGFAHHRKAWSGRPDPPCGPSGRFSTRFGTLGRYAKLHQNAGHHPTHLPRRDCASCGLPWTQHRLAEWLSQQQLIAGTGHDPTPAFDLLRRAQVCLGPEQVLLQIAIAMLEAQKRLRYQVLSALKTCARSLTVKNRPAQSLALSNRDSHRWLLAIPQPQLPALLASRCSSGSILVNLLQAAVRLLVQVIGRSRPGCHKLPLRFPFRYVGI